MMHTPARSGSNAGSFARAAAELNAGNSYLVNQRLAQVDRTIDARSAPRTSLYSTSGITTYGSGASRSLAQG